MTHEEQRKVIADVLHEAYCETAVPRDGKGRIVQCVTVADAILAALSEDQSALPTNTERSND